MARPSYKSPLVAGLLQNLAGRTTAILSDTCVKPPFGCGRSAPPGSFRDALSAKEFTVSGLCQSCQDEMFGTPED